MPEISRFLGIVVGMFYNEHGVAHFHAVYGAQKVSVEIETKRVHGRFPPRALQLVMEWADMHREELLAKVESMTAKFEGKVVPRPPHWHGYRLVPDRIEFWTAKPHRLHDRLAYTYHAGRWTKTLLYP